MNLATAWLVLGLFTVGSVGPAGASSAEPPDPRAPAAALAEITLAPREASVETPPRDQDATQAEAPADDLPLVGPAAEKPAPGEATPPADRARGFGVEPAATPERGAMWVPRVVFYPVNLVFKGLFWPVRKVLRAGKGNFAPYAKRVFYWNRAMTIGWLPHASYITNYGFTYGARVFHTNLIGAAEKLQAKALFGGMYAQRYQVRFEADRLAASRIWMDIRARYEATPVQIFRGFGELDPAPAGATGLGPRDGHAFTRFSQERVLAYLRWGYTLGPKGREVRPGMDFIYNHREFGPRRRSTGQPSIEQVYDTSLIPGFGEPSDLVQAHAVLDLDFRNSEGRPSRGFYFTAMGGGAPPQGGFGYGHYGAELTKYINLYKHTRILVLRGGLEALHAPDEDIPFAELALLGGAYRLRGYSTGWLRDKRAALGTIEYRFPIHQMLQGHLFADVGRVGRDYADLFELQPGEWNWGVGGGFTARTMRRIWLKFDMAYGEGFWWGFSLSPLQALRHRSKQ